MVPKSLNETIRIARASSFLEQFSRKTGNFTIIYILAKTFGPELQCILRTIDHFYFGNLPTLRFRHELRKLGQEVIIYSRIEMRKTSIVKVSETN